MHFALAKVTPPLLNCVCTAPFVLLHSAMPEDRVMKFPNTSESVPLFEICHPQIRLI